MKLQVSNRTVSGKKNKLIRKVDQTPAVVYGRGIDKATSIQFRRQDFVKLYKIGGQSTPITLEGDLNQDVLVHDMQIDPVTNEVLHIDFIALVKGEEVATEVSVIMTGEAPVTKSGDAKLQQVKDTVAIRAIPKNLPHDLTIDITSLETTNDVLFVKDIVVPTGVTITDNGDIAVVIVAGPGGKAEQEDEVEEITTEEAPTE